MGQTLRQEEEIMKLVTYQLEREQKTRIGVLNQDETWVYPIKSIGVDYSKMETLIEEIGESELQLLEYTSKKEPYGIHGAAPVGEVRLLAPIQYPKQDVICLGSNYMAHAEESARFKQEQFDGKREHAVYFSKRVNKASADGDPIPGHFDIVESLDYEAELAIIIRKEAKNVPPEKVKEYLFGYTIINDVSARNVQRTHKQYYFGKSLDGFLPMGPCITTIDTIPYPPKLSIQSRVNGELRQDSNTGLMIFTIDHIVSELSRGMTLQAGTIISTGTPAGVGMGFAPPRFLKAGDVVECTVEGIGSIKNRVE